MDHRIYVDAMQKTNPGPFTKWNLYSPIVHPVDELTWLSPCLKH